MRNTFISIAFSLILFVGFSFINPAIACHESSLTLDEVTDLGNNLYQIDLTFCAEGGEGENSITQSTRTFAFLLEGAIVTSFPSTLESPQTEAIYTGYFHNGQADTLIYLSPGEDWTCTSGCGPGQSYCETISLTTNGLPSSIFFIGAEGAGNPYGGCLGPDMYVYPDGNGPDPCETFTLTANAGNNKTVYYGWGPEECTVICASAGGTPSYPITYDWSNGVVGHTMTVCPSTTTTYTVTVTDNNGCTATDEVTVNSIDVRCGNKNDKILLCKPNGSKTICEKYGKVQKKLDEGYTLGACDDNLGISNQVDSRSIAHDDEIMAYPTIFADKLIVELNLDDTESVQVDLYDMMGALVKSIYKGSVAVQSIEVPTYDLSNQIYIVRMIKESGEISTLKVIKSQ